MAYGCRAAFRCSFHAIASHSDHATARLRAPARFTRRGNSPRRSSSQIADAILTASKAAEQAGFDAVAVADRIPTFGGDVLSRLV
jgi:hypothetical protein